VAKKEEGQLEDKSGGSDSVQVLGKAGGKVAQDRFHAFTKIKK
jgi:hypothetical protein